MFISIDTSTGAARSAAAGTTRTDCRRLFHSRQMSGGKGGKGGNPTAPIQRAGFVNDFDPFSVRRPARRKLAETGGNWRALHWRGTSGVAEIAENKFYVAARRSTAASRARSPCASPRDGEPSTGHARAVQHRLSLLQLRIGRALQRNKESGGRAPSCRIR